MVLSTNQKGAIAELAIAKAATELGIEVYRPMLEGGRFDLIFAAGERLLRIQCKWADSDGEVIAVRPQTCRRTRDGLLNRSYALGEIDAVAVYCRSLDRCYALPVALVAGRRRVHLRLSPSRNNQQAGINWAAKYEFGSLDWGDPGAIAQLGERLAGSQKVAGSSPASSIA